MIIQTAEYNAKLISIFIKWYFIEMPIKILNQLYKYIVVLTKIYSFVFLLKTLFSPWKNQTYSYPQKGFDIKVIFQTWIYNMIARVVGAVVRIVTILMGIFVLILISILGIAVLLTWLTYPVLFFVLIIISFTGI
jgi:hypothetical protein